MKKILLISALLFSFNSWAADDDLHTDGHFISYYPNGQVRLTGKVTDRKKSGLWQYYYDNGQLQQKENIGMASQLVHGKALIVNVN